MRCHPAGCAGRHAAARPPPETLAERHRAATGDVVRWPSGVMPGRPNAARRRRRADRRLAALRRGDRIGDRQRARRSSAGRCLAVRGAAASAACAASAVGDPRRGTRATPAAGGSPRRPCAAAISTATSVTANTNVTTSNSTGTAGDREVLARASEHRGEPGLDQRQLDAQHDRGRRARRAPRRQARAPSLRTARACRRTAGRRRTTARARATARRPAARSRSRAIALDRNNIRAQPSATIARRVPARLVPGLRRGSLLRLLRGASAAAWHRLAPRVGRLPDADHGQFGELVIDQLQPRDQPALRARQAGGRRRSLRAISAGRAQRDVIDQRADRRASSSPARARCRS